MHRYGNWWMLVGVLGLASVGVAAGVGNFGIALLLVLLAPIPLTACARQARRAAESER